MFSRPVSCPWNPVPTSSKHPTRPKSRASPAVGSVIRLSTLKSVLLPAPLRPITPSTSPRRRSNDTSRKAHNVSWPRRCNGCLRRCATSSASVPNCRRGPMRYCFESPRTEIARSLKDIGESPFHSLEGERAGHKHHTGNHGRVADRGPLRGGAAEERPTERLQQPG